MSKRFIYIVLLLTIIVSTTSACGTATETAVLPQSTSQPISQPTSEPISQPSAEPTISTGQLATEEPIGPHRGGTLRFATVSDLFMVDPHKVSGELREFTALAEGLTSLTPTGEIVPGLAESWEISTDGLIYTFHLRKGVKFHNGDALTSEHVKWSIDRILDPATEAVRFSDLQAISLVEAVDDNTVRITLKQPSTPFLAVLNDTFIIHPDSEQKDGTITHPIGTGPFAFVEWIPDQHLKYIRFAEYWQPGIPYVDELIQLPIVDEAARFAALQTGDVDIIYQYPRSMVAQAALSTEYDIAYNQASRWWALDFNNVNTPEPLKNELVRRAIAMSLDKTEINNLYEMGLGVVNNQWYAPGEFWFDDNLVDVYSKPQIEEAKALLAEAGYADGFELTLIAPNAYDIDRLVMVLADQIGRIGIKTNVEISDWSSYEARLSSGENWGISAMGYSPKSDPIMYWNTLRKGPQSAYMGGGVDDPELMAILDEAEAVLDPEARKQLYNGAYQLLIDKSYLIFLVSDFVIWGYRSNVQNFYPGNSFYNLQGGGFSNVWLEEP